jgi:hypothetical protein
MENPIVKSQTIECYVTADDHIQDGEALFKKLIAVLPGCCHNTFNEAEKACLNRYGDVIFTVRKLKITFEQMG